YPSMILRNPQFLIFLALIPALALAWRLRRGRVSGVALALRLLAVSLIVVALADPTVLRGAPPPRALVPLVGQPRSLRADGKAALRAQANALAAAHRGQVELIAFGANAVAETQGQLSDSDLRADNTDIAAALRAARGLIGPSGPNQGRVVLLSDGAQTRGDA